MVMDGTDRILLLQLIRKVAFAEINDKPVDHDNWSKPVLLWVNGVGIPSK